MNRSKLYLSWHIQLNKTKI